MSWAVNNRKLATSSRRWLKTGNCPWKHTTVSVAQRQAKSAVTCAAPVAFWFPPRGKPSNKNQEG